MQFEGGGYIPSMRQANKIESHFFPVLNPEDLGNTRFGFFGILLYMAFCDLTQPS